jgi:hypothetical protein
MIRRESILVTVHPPVEKCGNTVQEFLEIPEAVLKYFIDLMVTHFPIQMDQAIPELGHVPQFLGKFQIESSFFSHHNKRVAIVLGNPEAIS